MNEHMQNTPIERGAEIEALSDGSLKDRIRQEGPGIERLRQAICKFLEEDAQWAEEPERWDGMS